MSNTYLFRIGSKLMTCIGWFSYNFYLLTNVITTIVFVICTYYILCFTFNNIFLWYHAQRPWRMAAKECAKYRPEKSFRQLLKKAAEFSENVTREDLISRHLDFINEFFENSTGLVSFLLVVNSNLTYLYCYLNLSVGARHAVHDNIIR